MSSRLLARLDAAIGAATRDVPADALRCERAAYLARRGDAAAAAAELAAVRARNAVKPYASRSAWMHFADAVITHYRSQSTAAYDRMQRAHALSRAAGLLPLQALSAAWLGHFEYMRREPEALAQRAAEALRLAAPDHHAARARASLVVAQSYHDGGRHDLAKPWYDDAHRHAGAEGDEATSSAILWNMNAHFIVGAQQAESADAAAGIGGPRLLSATESASRYDALLGVHSFKDLAPILRAQVLTIEGRTAEALPLFEAHLAQAVAHGFDGLAGNYHADRGWCRLQTGDADGARADAVQAEAGLAPMPAGTSDHAAGRHRLAQLFDGLGEPARAAPHRALAAASWQVFGQLQARLVAALDRELPSRAPAAAGTRGASRLRTAPC